MPPEEISNSVSTGDESSEPVPDSITDCCEPPHSNYTLRIEPKRVGFLVKIGCWEIATSNSVKLGYLVSEWLLDPVKTQEKYEKIGSDKLGL